MNDSYHPCLLFDLLFRVTIFTTSRFIGYKYKLIVPISKEKATIF